MNYDLLIFDFDGTLADSLPRAARIYNELAVADGVLPIADTLAVREMTIGEFLKAHRIPFHKVPSLTARFLAAQKSYTEPLQVFPGIAPAVRALRDGGVRMAVVSSNNRETIAECLGNNGLHDCFDFNVGCSRLFGKHRAIRGVVRSAGVPAARALYVGDETRDIEAARKAGIGAAAVTWGFNSARLLKRFGPAHLINRPEELENVCRNGAVEDCGPAPSGARVDMSGHL